MAPRSRSTRATTSLTRSDGAGPPHFRATSRGAGSDRHRRGPLANHAPHRRQPEAGGLLSSSVRPSPPDSDSLTVFRRCITGVPTSRSRRGCRRQAMSFSTLPASLSHWPGSTRRDPGPLSATDRPAGLPRHRIALNPSPNAPENVQVTHDRETRHPCPTPPSPTSSRSAAPRWPPASRATSRRAGTSISASASPPRWPTTCRSTAR